MMEMKKVLMATLAGTGVALCAGTSQAALIESDLETFSGGGSSSANTSIYTLSSSGVSSFTLENSVTDGTFFDGADDGYAHVQRTSGSNATNVVLGAYGTIETSDIGKEVVIDAAFRHETGVTVDWSIQLDGANIGVQGDQSFFRASSFSSSDLNPDTNYRISNVVAVAQNIGRTTGALTYTIQAGDVGKALGLRINSFDSVGNREFYIDSISYAVPEPGSLALLAAGGLCVLRRRR